MEKYFNQLYSQLENRLVEAVLTAIQNKIHVPEKQSVGEVAEWMDLKTAAKYVGVSQGTFYNFRLHGLKVTEIDNVKRVNKSELDRFMKKHSK